MDSDCWKNAGKHERAARRYRMIDLAFVVLNYMTPDKTIRCVESIRQRAGTESCRIVIVDNASPNGCGNDLKNRYLKDADVHVILLKKNMGFARGNNRGIEYARKVFSPRFLIVLNSDVVLMGRKLFGKIEDAYQEKGFAVLGPLVLSGDGKYISNPMKPMTNRELKKRKNKNRLNVLLDTLHIWKPLFILRHAIITIIKKNRDEGRVIDVPQKQENVKLQGCFLCFSERFFDKLAGFDERTFLFGEEELLYRKLKDNSLISLFDPDITVYHEEHASTRKMLQSNRAMRMFSWKEQIRSQNIILNVKTYNVSK